MSLFSNDVKKLNYYASWLHGLSFAGILGVFLAKNEDVNFSTELFRFQVIDLQDGDKTSILDATKVTVVSTDILKTCILLMFLITAIFHTFYYTDGFGTGVYTQQLNLGRNAYRWIEYAITSTIMIFVLSIMSGVKDIYSVYSLCASNLVLMSIGYFVEMVKDKKSKIIGLGVGFYLLVSIWYVILDNFYNRISEVENIDNPNNPGEKRQIAGWIKQVLMPMFLWYVSFGVVAIFYARNYDKPGFDFRTYERYYIILSYLSKAFMGYYLAFGLTRPKNKDSE